MNGTRMLVTGATGFIGRNLVRYLVSRGADVTCLVRENSDIAELKKWNCRLVKANIEDPPGGLKMAVGHQEVIFHLAARTNSLTRDGLFRANVKGFEHLLTACQQSQTPSAIVFVSSIAAVGSNPPAVPHLETTPCNPVSDYGRSKHEAEMIATRYADRLPISIVRPPIVLGPWDRTGLEMFKSIDTWGLHVVPGFREQEFSVIHVGDLVSALVKVALHGSRLNGLEPGRGIYFAAANKTPTYDELGHMIANALGKKRVKTVRVPLLGIRTVANINSVVGFIRQNPCYLNRDKAREACAGSWSCCDQKIRDELGYEPAFPLEVRLRQTVEWYRSTNWLKKSRRDDRARTWPALAPENRREDVEDAELVARQITSKTTGL